MTWKHAHCLRLQVDAGIADDLVFGDPKAPRFVFWDKKLRPTPSGPDVLTFDLLSIWGKIRAGQCPQQAFTFVAISIIISVGLTHC